ncbi:hypothetical protein [Natrarchaeobius oligotrophus]|uniref:Uncharacterized protein n=1 Tax=Natrarchaeobius chitinivorans TaxID=1679083 RepID=A0A3N6MQ28_NATCH|nr:hypothetical protein [Natrarchaeobius chitinivorans]RQG98311.1 hypothetical protein EA472_18025 [Natrarchaeobius chitinivorans]
MDLPELPYDNVHKFLATIGFVLVLTAIAIEPVYLENQEIFSIGATALILGLLGWGIERVYIPPLQELDRKPSLSHGEKQWGRRWSNRLRWFRFLAPVLFLLVTAAIIVL